jgi:hypothetical protein
VNKSCSKCGFIGDAYLFPKGRRQCYPCRRAYDKIRNYKNKDKRNARQRELRRLRTPEKVLRERLAHTAYMREKYSERQMLISARKNAKKKSLPFNLDLSDIKIPERCPLLDIKLYKNGNFSNRDTSPSLDRIEPDIGYVKGNIRVVSYRANRIKNDATPEELKMISRRIDEYCKNTHKVD